MHPIEGFTYLFEPATQPGLPTLLLLHGTGGDEHDLVSLGHTLLPGAALLAPRGQVLERGMPRYFKRLAEGVFDLEDLALRTDQLARFIPAAAKAHGVDATRIVAVGFSNGANIAASVLLTHPNALAGAVLYRAMVPFEPATLKPLPGTPVWLGAGRHDPMIPLKGSERLAALLTSAGAVVTLDLRDAGHNLTAPEVEATKPWLATQRWPNR